MPPTHGKLLQSEVAKDVKGEGHNVMARWEGREGWGWRWGVNCTYCDILPLSYWWWICLACLAILRNLFWSCLIFQVRSKGGSAINADVNRNLSFFNRPHMGPAFYHEPFKSHLFFCYLINTKTNRKSMLSYEANYKCYIYDYSHKHDIYYNVHKSFFTRRYNILKQYTMK